MDSKAEAEKGCKLVWLFYALRENEKQLMGVEYMKKVTLKWKVAKKPERIVQKAASHFTFKSCTVKCGE